MSPGLRDDDNPWNDQHIPDSTSTPDIGLGAAALVGARSSGALGAQNGHAGNHSAAVDDKDLSNGDGDARWRNTDTAGGAGSPNAPPWPSAADSTSNPSSPSRTSTASNGATAPNGDARSSLRRATSTASSSGRRPSGVASPPAVELADGWTSTTSMYRSSRRPSQGSLGIVSPPPGPATATVDAWAPAASLQRSASTSTSTSARHAPPVVELADGWTSTTSMYKSSRRPSQGSASIVSPSPAPDSASTAADGWALRRSPSTSTSTSARPGMPAVELGDAWMSTTIMQQPSRRPSESTSIVPAAGVEAWTSATSLQRSASTSTSASVSRRRSSQASTSVIPTQPVPDAWASATNLQRSASTSTSASTSARRASQSQPTGPSIFATPPPAPSNQLRRRRGGGHAHTRSQTIDVTHDVHPLSQPPSPAASPPPPSPPRLTHTVARTDSLAGVALRYGVSVAALRRANGLWASDSIHLRASLVIPSGDGFPSPPRHSRASTTVDPRASTTTAGADPPRPRASLELSTPAPAPRHARASTDLADIAASFSLTLPRLRLSLDRDPESDAEHELVPLSLGARRRKSRPQLAMSAVAPGDGLGDVHGLEVGVRGGNLKTPTTKQPSPIRGMVLPRP